jgi:hypothetical protein
VGGSKRVGGVREFKGVRRCKEIDKRIRKKESLCHPMTL